MGQDEKRSHNRMNIATHTSTAGHLLVSGALCLTPLTLRAQQPAGTGMERDTMRIEEVVVMGRRTQRPIKNTTVTTRVLSGKQLVEAGYSDFQQALQHETPGLSIQKVNFGSEMNLDGLDARHVLFLMDGERMTGDIAGNLDYERFNLHAIDRVEIVKGASSTLYGSRASGAVINIITKKTQQPFTLDAGARWGTMNERNYKNPVKKDFNYMFEKNSDRPNLQAWLSAGAKNSWLTSQTDVWYGETDAFYLYQAKGDRKVYTREANPFLDEDIVIQSSFPRPPMGVEGGEHISTSQRFHIEPVKNFKAQVYGSAFFMNQYDLVQDLVFTQSRDYTWGAKAAWTLDGWFTVTASLHNDYYDRFKRHERRDERKAVYHSRIMQPRLTIESRRLAHHALIMGVEYCEDELTSDRFVNHKMTSRALKETEWYAQDDWDLKRWTLSYGVRTNFSEAFGFMWMPKVAAKYSPSERWTLRANYSMGYRSPSIKELFFNWDHLGMFMIKGNENLQPEKNNYFSAGAEYDNGTVFLNATAYANLFRHKIEGVWRIYDLQYNFEYTNLSHQTMTGIDLVGRWRPLPELTVNGSYSYVYISKEDGLHINTTSPHAATIGGEYRWQQDRNHLLTVSVNTQIMGRKQYDVQDRVWVEKDNRSHDAYFRCTLPTYALCNIHVAQTFHNRLRLSAGVDNVFNYRPKTLGSGLTAFSVPATAGARCYVQMEVKLNKQ